MPFPELRQKKPPSFNLGGTAAQTQLVPKTQLQNEKATEQLVLEQEFCPLSSGKGTMETWGRPLLPGRGVVDKTARAQQCCFPFPQIKPTAGQASLGWPVKWPPYTAD